LAMKW